MKKNDNTGEMMIIFYLKRRTIKLLGGAFLGLLLLFGGVLFLPKVAAVSVTGEKPVYSVEQSEKTMALSFDASWGAEHTENILATLAENNVKTTFFLVDLWIDEYPEMVKAIHEAGHEIGLHSATHPHFPELSKEQMKEELTKNQTSVRNITGYDATLFRPPFGDYNNEVLNTASELGLTTVQWSVDSLDWKGLSAQEITDRVLSGAAPGAIVLLHNNGDHTAEALKQILPALKEKGYTVVPVGKLLPQDGYTDSNGILHPEE